jgi:hypothetical protein
LYVNIALGILILVAIVVAFFAARTWHWSQVVVVIGIVLSTAGFFLLSAELLRINAVLRSKVNQLEEDLAEVEADNNALAKGTEDSQVIARLRNSVWPNEAAAPIPEEAEKLPSLADLKHELHLATRDRGRVWRKVVPAGIQPTGDIRIGVEAPVPSGIAADTIVFLFEEGEPELPAAGAAPRGPQYLGEFRVTEAAAQGATLQPVLPLDDFERRRLASSRGPWVMYEVMPTDRYEIFAGLSEEDLKKQLPPRSVNEYVRHGKEASADDDDLRKAGFDETDKRLPPDQIANATKTRYHRRLRDYALEFDQLAKQRAVLATDLEGVNLDIERLKASLVVAEQLKTFRQDEIRKLTAVLTGVAKERATIAAHLKQVQQQLARAEALLAETLRRNSDLARQLAARQSRYVAPAERGPVSAAAPRGPLALDSVR